MAQFYLQISPGDNDASVDSTLEFATLTDATVDAATALARMIAEAIAQPVPRIMFVVVRDEQQNAVARVTLSLDIQVPPRGP